ncbi:MAG: hypothetical protein AB7F76_09100 [Parvibaculaceae bacterium]
MKRMSDSALKMSFLGWQCRIRQMAMRDHGGMPMPATQPSVSSRKGELLMPEMTILLVPLAPRESTAFFRFQIQKTHDERQIFDAGVKYLGGGYYQDPEAFSDEMTAVFAANSPTAAGLVKARTVLLDFGQFAQSYRMFCTVRRLPPRSVAREATLWHNRLFNPALPNNAEVLGFKPDWKNAAAHPWPGD